MIGAALSTYGWTGGGNFGLIPSRKRVAVSPNVLSFVVDL
jgi:hypothetical protein